MYKMIIPHTLIMPFSIKTQLHAFLKIIIIRSKNSKLIIEIPLVETCHQLDTDYILIYVEADKYIRKCRFLDKEGSDENIFEKFNELQDTKDLSSSNQKYTIFNNGNINDLKDSFNKLYKELDNEQLIR